jgi:uncharacterized lipoprotein
MRRSTSIIAAGSIALLGVAVLAGCSSSSSPAPAASASAAASNAQVLPPVMVAEDVTTATAKVGDFIVIQVTKLAGTTIATSTPDLLEVTQGGSDGSAEFNPGAKALAVGTGIITVTKPDGSTYDLTVTITE